MAVKPPRNTSPLPPAESSLRPSAPDMDWPLATTAHRKSKVLPLNFTIILPPPPSSLLPPLLPPPFLPSYLLPPLSFLLPSSSLPPSQGCDATDGSLIPNCLPYCDAAGLSVGERPQHILQESRCAVLLSGYCLLLPPTPPSSPSSPFLSPLPHIYQSCKS